MVTSPKFIYVGNAVTRDISAFRIINEEADLEPIGTFAVPGPTKFHGSTALSSPMAVSPDKRLLFVTLRVGQEPLHEPWAVRSFAIDAVSGQLDYLGFGPLVADTSYISTDKTGRFLLSASWPGSKIAVNPISPEGIVQPAQQVIETEPNMHSIRVDAANRYALAACTHGDIFYQWRFDSETGRLTPNEPPFVSVMKNSGPRHFVFHPGCKTVYLLSEHAARLYVYDYDADSGTLAEKQVADAAWPPGTDVPVARSHDIRWAIRASDIHVTPDGRFLYASERNSNTLAMFKVDPQDRRLSLIGHILTDTQPRGFAIDPSGHVLYCAGQSSGRLSSYSIDGQSGELTNLKEFRVGEGPNWIEIIEMP